MFVGGVEFGWSHPEALKSAQRTEQDALCGIDVIISWLALLGGDFEKIWVPKKPQVA